MTVDGHWLTTIAHHEHFLLRWAKNLSKFGSVASEEKSSEILNNFPIQMLWGSYKCIGKQTWPCRKKVKCQRTTTFLATSVDLLSLMICTQIQPQGSSVLERRFLKRFTIYGHGGHLGQWTTTILAIFRSPGLRRLNMKFEQIWLSGFREEVI